MTHIWALTGSQDAFGIILVISQLTIPVVIIVSVLQALWVVVWNAYVKKFGTGELT